MNGPIPEDDPVYRGEVEALLSTVTIDMDHAALPWWARDPATAAQFAAAVYLAAYPAVSLVYDEHDELVGYYGIRPKTDAELTAEGRST